MRYLITGGSGYIGGRLIDELSGRDETELIVDLDINEPPRRWEKTEFVRGDVRDGTTIRGLLESKRIDALIHLAFIFNPIRDEVLMYDVDVNGTINVLRAASDAGTQQVLVASSAIAYGAWPDNPRPIAEDHPVRGMPDFSYARDKADSDRVCQLWGAEHPDRVMTIVRPCIVLGPGVANFIFNTWEKAPFLPLPDGVNEDVQFVHVDDLVTALVALLDARATGPFNVAADGTMTWKETAEMAGMKVREMPYRRAYRLYDLAWRMRLSHVKSPPGTVATLRHPWVVSNERLKAATDWRPTLESREIFEQTLRAKGKLAPEAAAAKPQAPVA